MKRILWLFLPIIYIACSNEFEDQLRGQWQLQSIVMNGKDSLPEIPSYYCFQNSVFQIKDKSGMAFGRYYKKDDSLCIIFEDSLQAEALLNMKYTDWKSAYRSFYISEQTPKHISLKDKNKTLNFRYY
ncbi:lipocalin-like domain-containing protein [Parabacteroides sp. FAFU027]|uniref:lipocalin-like domain-containing protein n=1 Tax=Parabacteroides sp. FAFU027 TaxID=2922715 RepID=UPI001FAF3F3D|nr:lipocalin-like domain-containing protein [Parabacteroides sp. FAFU027]